MELLFKNLCFIFRLWKVADYAERNAFVLVKEEESRQSKTVQRSKHLASPAIILNLIEANVTFLMKFIVWHVI